jgi:hypothetical protein
MKFAFCLFKYFPYGGLQRDFLQIAETCISRSHQIDVYTGSWTGDKPDALNIVILPPKALTNHRRYKTFAARVNHHISTTPYDAVVGFNKIPGLDVYFAADVCYRAMAMERSFLYRLSNRCRTLMALERSVFDRHSTTLILSLSDTEKKRYFLKRFLLESVEKEDNFIKEGGILTYVGFDWRPLLTLQYEKQRGKDQPLNTEINVEEFISVKGFNALGNQLTDKKLKVITLKDALPYEEIIEDVVTEIEVDAEDVSAKSSTPNEDEETQFSIDF